MKCKGTIKIDKKSQVCGNELHPHQIFCNVCGEPTDALKSDLSAKMNFRKVREAHKSSYQKNLSLGIFLTLAIYIPIAILAAIFWNDYIKINLIMLFAVPFAMIPLAIKEDYSIKGYFAELKNYPRYLIFVLLAELYFFLLKVICTGFLLNIMVDAVLHIVRLIMVVYGIVCAFSAPFLMADKKMNPFAAIHKSIKAGHEPRWQIFFTLIYFIFSNLIGALLLLIGMLYTLPLSYKFLRRYYHKIDEFELFDSQNPSL